MMCESEVECTSWIRLFRAFDLDHDGFIPTTDLKRAIRDSAFSFGLNPEEVVTMLANIDDNGDKLIDFPEFCTLMSRAKHRRVLHLMFRAVQFVVPKSKRSEPFDYLQKYKCCPPPVFMLIISIIQVAIYIYYTIESGEGVSITGPVPSKSPLIFNPYRKSEVWRYITYMFIHIGIYHVTYNVLTQLLLGVPLELVHQWRVIVVYLAGVLSGSLLVSAVDSRVFLAGASGGVYALLAAHLAELIMNWSEMEFNWIRAIVLVILIGSDTAVSVYQRYFVDRVDRVSYVSHIGGFVAGVLLGVVILRNFRRHRWEGKLWWASLVAFVFFIAICVVLIIAPDMMSF
ncbi:peptidase, S54 family [Teladorsagia circumcincta]|uniref:rhomboid protease n=1 Tax=Teladorsagia circumcincta TaxID=45464 RepID=A0A2G9TYJ9_TELCI|nr:peptidase, S54 family [Teladorsagia circumcincta]